MNTDLIMDEFERDLIMYSEIETVIDTNTNSEQSLPRSLQKYKQIMRNNNSGSIFDANYSIEDENKIFNEDVTYVNSGRGRGGRMTFFKPGTGLCSDKIGQDDELLKQIRKVSGLGYSNELIESSLKVSRKLKNKEVINEFKESGEKSDSSSAQSTCSRIISDKASTSGSNYYTASDVNCSNSPGIKSTYLKEFEANTPTESLTEMECIRNDLSPSSSETNIKENIPTKPLPLSLLRKRCNEQHKQKKASKTGSEPKQNKPIKNLEILTETYQNVCGGNGLSLLLPVKNYKNDSVSITSSTSSSNSGESILPWRTRTNSPPKYPWGKPRSPRSLNIYCSNEFPVLK